MLPIASSSGPAIIGAVVVASGLFLAWLLRLDRASEAAREDEREPDAAEAETLETPT
jgi:hypothetical protein